MSDDNRDERLNSRSQSGPRKERSQDDRPVTQNRQTNADRLTMFRNKMFQSALPELPKIPGYHVCWLTTTNPRDSIQGRTLLGYEPIKATDHPGFDSVTMKTGEYAGCIGVNEMLAFKVPQELYEMYMKEAHHNAPLQEELKLRAALDVIKQQAEAKGAEVVPEEGNAELGQIPTLPDGKPMFEVV